ncbi:MAG: hypothetical protein [Podoviridae sp. cty5g4]|nr:MAG: hypothetical protein [Podoviridae sp. cty5g4]
MTIIKKLINGKMVKVSVVDKCCKTKPCLVITSCNSPGKFYCRTHEVKGCT